MKKIRKLWRRAAGLLLTAATLLSTLPAALAAEPVYQASLDQGSLSMKVGETKNLTVSVEKTTVPPEGGEPQTSVMTWEEFQADSGSIVWKVREEYSDRLRVTPSEQAFSASVAAIGTAETTQDETAVVEATITIGVGAPIVLACQVTISPSDPAGVTVTPLTTEVAPGKSVQLRAEVQPATAPQQVTWSSADETIATVDTAGLVTGRAAGQVRITATSATQSASCLVTVQGIVLKDDTLQMKERGTANLEYQIYGDLLSKTVEWSSSDPSVVEVNNGYLSAKQEGTAVVTAKVAGSIYTDTCTVEVKRNTADVITRSVDAGEPLSFSGIQTQLERQCSNVLGRSLSYISGLSVDTRQGTLYYRYQSENDTGAGIGTGERYYTSASLGQMALSDVTFVPKSDFSGTAVIQYTGYADGANFFQGTIEVQVAELEEISYSAIGGKAIQFDVDSFNRMCRNRTGRDLSYVIFSQPDSDRGTLYYHYMSPQNPGTKVETDKEYRRNGSPSLSEVYFLPDNGYTGDVVVSYTAWDVNGDSFRGRVRIRVTEATATGDLNYSISQGGRLTMDEDDFNDLSEEATGYALDYVRFSLPASSRGTLYYNYTSSGNYDSRVEEGRSYYRNSSPYLRRVTFVAEDSFTGTVTLNFTGWDVKGNQFSGQVEISVGKVERGDIRYSTYQGGKVTMDDNDFNALCRDLTDSSLKYVRFDLPSSSQGTLYYNYTSGSSYDSKVSASKSYYRSASPYLDRVTFVPRADFTGTVSIPFTGWSTSNERFEGTVEIGVDAGDYEISYQVRSGQAVTFDEDDFDDLSEFMTGEWLKYVRFELPSSSKGTLYYNYNDGKYDSKVSESRSYYLSSSPYLDRVSFVAAENYSGTVTIDFTGWNTDGKTFDGEVKITVEAPVAPTLITYTSDQNGVTFRSQDFVNACLDRGMGNLVSVRFSNPNTTYGTLYERYQGTSGANSQVTTGTRYYPNGSPSLSQVTFVPKVGVQGPVVITYTGEDSRGNTYDGQIRVVVQSSSNSRYFNDLNGYSWAVSSVDQLYQKGVVSGVGGGNYGPGQSITRGDFMLMLYRAFELPALSATGFSDVPSGSYYGQAIQTARALGISAGYPDGSFHPKDPVTRQDAMVFLKRAMEADGWNLGNGDTVLLNGFQDGNQVSNYARDAVSTMVSYGILTGTPEERLNPLQPMTRAEMAVVLAQALSL